MMIKMITIGIRTDDNKITTIGIRMGNDDNKKQITNSNYHFLSSSLLTNHIFCIIINIIICSVNKSTYFHSVFHLNVWRDVRHIGCLAIIHINQNRFHTIQEMIKLQHPLRINTSRPRQNGRYKLQTTSSNSFPCKKSVLFWLKFHSNVFVVLHLTPGDACMRQ